MTFGFIWGLGRWLALCVLWRCFWRPGARGWLANSGSDRLRQHKIPRRQPDRPVRALQHQDDIRRPVAIHQHPPTLNPCRSCPRCRTCRPRNSPLPLTKQQTTELVALLKNPPAGEEATLVELITYRVPAGVDDAAKVKAEFLAKVAKGEEACALISEEKSHRTAWHDAGRRQRQAADRPAGHDAHVARLPPKAWYEDPAGSRLFPRCRGIWRSTRHRPTPRRPGSRGPTASGSPRVRKSRLRRS